MGAHSKPGVRPVLALAEQALVDPHGLCVTKLQPPESADMPTHRGLPAQVPTDDPSCRYRPSHSSSRSGAQAIPAVVARSATALRKRPQTNVRSAWSSAPQKLGLNRPVFSFDQLLGAH